MTSNPWIAILTVLVLTPAAGHASVASTPQGPRPPFEQPGEPTARNEIDEFVFARLKQRRVRPARPCSDAVFLRRVHLDLIGTLPSAREARAFLRDQSPEKRSALVEHLLERPEFAEYQAMKWADLLRVKSEFPVNLWPNAAQAYHVWIRDCISKGMTYDRFARELLTSSGSNFRVPQVNFYRAAQSKEPQELARVVALTFLGVRAESWPQERLAGMAGFFSRVGFKSTAEWKEEIVYFDASRAPTPAVFPDGETAEIPADRDPRQAFAAWLIRPSNPWFARCVVNRVWSWMFGRGLVHEPDDIREDNPPSHPGVLRYLEREFLASGCDIRRLYRRICASQTYQLSCIPRSDSPDVATLFAAYPVRRLEAEVLIDAINQITGGTERYTSPIPEPFTFLPPNQRAISIPDGSITSSFLEMFGRPPRDTGLQSERSNQPSARQRLHLINSSHIQKKIEQGSGLRFLRQSRGAPREALDQLYLTVLSRFPTSDELATVTAFARDKKTPPRSVGLDVAWALLNSAEFLHRH